MFSDTRQIGKKPSTRRLNQIDREIEQIYRRHCCGVEINVMDIGKVFAAGRAAALAGQPITPAILATVTAVTGWTPPAETAGE